MAHRVATNTSLIAPPPLPSSLLESKTSIQSLGPGISTVSSPSRPRSYGTWPALPSSPPSASTPSAPSHSYSSAIWDGERLGDVVWAGVWCGAARHVRGIHAEVMDHSQLHRGGSALRFHCLDLEADWPDKEYLRCSRDVSAMDDTPALHLRHELPHCQVPAGLEQNHSNSGDLCGGAGPPHRLQLAPDAKAGMGPSQGQCGPQRLLGGYHSCLARLHLQWHMRSGLVGVLMEGLPQPLELCATFPHLRRNALVSYPPS
ncbi:hypothetical protein SAY86_015632 [Trapa natans]|uniref:Uncharacterized protein n=1 Tax=Trapa natans TaxID=22666 RepID=A0AAN7LAU2_TRANT|nr:hypothetical protein SAY86_015632 [Trapa natans]